MADENELTENQVVAVVATWLRNLGFELNPPPRMNREHGDDISALDRRDGTRLFVECKGSINESGGALRDWNNSAMAVFGAIKEIEEKRPKDLHGIAVPDTEPYRKTLAPLNEFFIRQGIVLLCVRASGEVIPAGKPSPSLQPPNVGRR